MYANLNAEDKKRILVNFIQNEGYTDDGFECDGVEEYYRQQYLGVRMIVSNPEYAAVAPATQYLTPYDLFVSFVD